MKEKINHYSSFLFLLLVFVTVVSCTGNSMTDKAAINETEIQNKLNNELKQYFNDNQAGAVIIAMKDGKVIYRNAFGLANVELNVPLKPEMVFKLGSMTKQFTAVGIMILVEDGKIQLDDPIAKILPDYSTKFQNITIKQLLNHTSGIPNHTLLKGWYDTKCNPITTDQLIDLFINEEPDFEPGTKWQYSNSGYVLLTKVIETVSGMTYEEFMIKNIFNPSGMKNTSIAKDYVIVPNLVDGYRKVRETDLKAEYMSNTHLSGGGCIISNVDDLTKWMRVLELNEIISKENLDICWTPSELSDGTKTDYGLGWYIGNFNEKLNINHGGGLYGFVNHAMYLPEEKLYIAILSNYSDPYTKAAKHFLCNVIAEIILDEKQPEEEIERVAINLPAETLAKYEGIYRFDTGGRRRISIEDGKVYYEIPPMHQGNPWSKNEIFPASETVFFVPGKKTTIEFTFDHEKKVSGLSVNQRFGRVVKLIKEK